jgi:YNFM family putative membrane transporter
MLQFMFNSHDAASVGHLPGTGTYWRILSAMFCAGLATFALLNCTQAIQPEFALQFSVSAAETTLTVSLTTLGLGAGLLVAGPLSDVFGRTRLIHLSLLSSSVIAACCAFAPNWTALLTLRALEGVALAGLPAVAIAYLREELHANTHARAAGLYIAGTAIGGMTGRLLTGAVADVGGWRWALAAVAVLGLACALATLLILPPSHRFEPAPTGLSAMLRSARRALRDPALLALYGVGACAAGALNAMFNTVGFRLNGDPFLLSMAAASMVFLVYPIGAVSSAVSGRMVEICGRRPILPLGCLIATTGIALTLLPALPWVVVGLALLTAGVFGVHAVASGWVTARAHAAGGAAGQAAAFYLFAYYSGSSLFGNMAGHMWDGPGWWGVVTLATVLFAVAGALALVLRRSPRLQGSDAAQPALSVSSR